LYDPSKPLGSRWTFDLAPSKEERMYHSTVVLLLDGSLLISGSNPNKDYTTQQWGTKYGVERWYPSWYNDERPILSDPPSTISYGGEYFNLTLGRTTSESTAKSAKVVLIRGGFSTHAMSMGQRYVELDSSYFIDAVGGTTTLFVSQLPPNPAILAPGPAMLFLVVNGVPSEGQFVMVGSGYIGTQPTLPRQALPQSRVYIPPSSSASSEADTPTQSTSSGTGAGTSVNATSGSTSRIVSSWLMASLVTLLGSMIALA
jgi:hypothetical protein